MMPFTFTTATNARFNFEFALSDVSALLKIHDEKIGGKKGRPDESLEVFKRAGVILAVTAWEAYIEDTLTERVQRKLNAVTTPTDMSSAFNSVSQVWLAEQPRPPELAKWTGDGWKAMVQQRVKLEIEALNTPNSQNIKRLFNKYLGVDIIGKWKWHGASSAQVAKKLDNLISLRGELVHRGRELFQTKAQVRRVDLVNAIALTQKLVEKTDSTLGIAPVVTTSPGFDGAIAAVPVATQNARVETLDHKL